MPPLNYASANPRKPTSWVFWLVFCTVGVAGTVGVGKLDAYVQRQRGTFSDGNMMCVGLVALALAAWGLMFTGASARGRVWIACSCAAATPFLAYGFMWLIAVVAG